MQRKFIEYDLPLEKISDESAREKNIRHGHPSTLHIWWARRPLAASRATAFASLINDPGSENPKRRKVIMKLIKDISPWEAVKNGNSKKIEEAQKMVKEQYGEDPPKVLDPFAGGGSIPLETLRLGAETYSSDYNPVAAFIEKATVGWPQKFGVEIEVPETLRGNEGNQNGLSLKSGQEKVNLLNFMVERWANIILNDAEGEIGQFYPKESSSGLVGKRELTEEEGWIPVGYLWARTIHCQNPTCDTDIPLIRQYWLAKKENKKIGYRPIIDDKNDEIDFKLLEGEEFEAAMDDGFDPKDGTVSRANATCPVCGQVTEAEKVRQLSRDGKMDQRMIAVVFRHPDQTGKRYRLAKQSDIKTFENAKDYLVKKLHDWPFLDSPLPNEKMVKSSRYMLPTNYGIEHWKSIFNPRQQLALVTFLEKIRSSYEQIKNDVDDILKVNRNLEIEAESLVNAIIGYLAVMLDRVADFGTNLSVLNHVGARGVTHVFGRQALPMVWDYIETNVFNPAAASWYMAIDRTLRCLKVLVEGTTNETVATTKQHSATDLPYEDGSLDAVITDPPYYDNVPYAALSDFFYVWLKRSVGEYFPELFSTPVVKKSDEAIMEPTRHENKTHAKEFFERKLGQSFQEIHRVLKEGGTATIVYAHKTTEGWETMLNGLIDAGFVVTASWPVHTEKEGRLRARASAALASSIYMVCRKVKRESLGFWKDIKSKIKERVEEKLNQFWQEGIVGGDLFISAIGPGVEVFSKYEKVQKYSGEEVSTLELLTYIRSITTDFVVNRLLQEASPSQIDKESQFYLAYRWTYLDNKIEYDAARKIASGMGVDIEELDDSYGFVKKTRKYVRVYGPNDRTDYDGNIDEIEIGSMVDAMHKSLLLWGDGRKDEINELLAETGYAEQGSFWQFCQAVSESLVQGNDEKQKLEGFLMGRDKYVQSAKEMNKQAEKTKDMFEEE